MIDVRQAVRAALSYIAEFSQLLPQTDLRLEETELDEETGDWLITLSFLENALSTSRQYKSFRIDRTSGDVIWMRVRTPEAF